MYDLTWSSDSEAGTGHETNFTWRGDAAKCKGAVLCPVLGEGACGDFGIVIDEETQVCFRAVAGNHPLITNLMLMIQRSAIKRKDHISN